MTKTKHSNQTNDTSKNTICNSKKFIHTKPNINLSKNPKERSIEKNVDFPIYSSIEDIKKLTNKNKLNSDQYFSIIHINLRSINKNFDKLRQLIAELPFDPSCIAVTETKINKRSNLDCIKLSNYEFIHTDSLTCAGGVGLYIKNSFNYEERKDLQLYNENYESVWTNIKIRNKKLTIGVIYRHPNRFIKEFSEDLSKVFLNLTSNKNDCILIGDFNIDYNKINKDPLITNYFDMTNSFNFYNKIQSPTRITANSATVIDHLYINNNSNFSTTTIINDISDHLPILGLTKTNRNTKKPDIVYKRNYKKLNKDNFFREIQYRTQNLNQLFTEYPETESNTKLQFLQESIKVAIDNNIPVHKLSKKKFRLSQNPWVTKNILKDIKTKNKLYKKLVKGQYKNKPLLTKYKKIRNNLHLKIKNLKQEYYKKRFSETYNDSKGTWNVIFEIIGKTDKKSTLPTQLLINGQITENQEEIANHLNNHFATIGNTSTEPIDYIKINNNMNHQNHSIYFNDATTDEISKIITNLKNKKSSGYDQIPIFLLKMINELISPILKQLFNEFLRTGIYPDCLKIAKIIPLHKSGNKQDPSNYRPISILPVINKIFEKLIYNRLNNFFEKYNIIQETQFGFRKGYSTDMAVSKFYEDTLLNLDNNISTCAILLDLSKAFDSVNRDILLFKLYRYGIRGNINKLIKSYLEGRKQFIEYNNNLSQLTEVKIGVPQGSILSPLLFLIMINDLINCSNFKVINFADDTLLYFRFKNKEDVNTILNKELQKINEWMVLNHLKLNISKTKFMVFSPRSAHPTSLQISLKLGNNQEIKQVSHYKYLGLILDDKLSWKEHISFLSNKLSRALGMLFKIRHFIKKQTILILIHSIFLTHIRYGILCWGRADKTAVKPIEILLNRAIRCINFHKREQGKTTPLFYKDKILKLKEIFNLELAKFMHKYTNNYLPKSFNEYFNPAINIHSHNTRNIHNKFFIPRVNKKLGQKSISFLGSQSWNNIPNSLKDIKYSNTFAKKYKNHLLETYN